MEESEEDQVKMSKEKGTYYENTQDDPQVAIVETGKTQCSFVSGYGLPSRKRIYHQPHALPQPIPLRAGDRFFFF